MDLARRSSPTILSGFGMVCQTLFWACQEGSRRQGLAITRAARVVKLTGMARVFVLYYYRDSRRPPSAARVPGGKADGASSSRSPCSLARFPRETRAFEAAHLWWGEGAYLYAVCAIDVPRLARGNLGENHECTVDRRRT
jgi:hypothetical protein